MDGPVTGDGLLLLYSLSAGTPVFVEVEQAKDVSWPIDFDEADVSARLAGWKLSEPALASLELTFGYQYVKGVDPVFDALFPACLAKTPLYWAIADGPLADPGTRVFKFMGKLFGLDNQEPLDNGKVLDLKAKPCWPMEDGELYLPTFETVEEEEEP